MPHDVIMPALGMAQETGVILSWLKKPGDQVSLGDALMEVETDKAVMEVESSAAGRIERCKSSCRRECAGRAGGCGDFGS